MLPAAAEDEPGSLSDGLVQGTVMWRWLWRTALSVALILIRPKPTGPRRTLPLRPAPGVVLSVRHTGRGVRGYMRAKCLALCSKFHFSPEDK